MWECGLKRGYKHLTVISELSLPMWECGLKLQGKEINLRTYVTPHVGVWIETFLNSSVSKIFASLPMWECGLKQDPRRVLE